MFAGARYVLRWTTCLKSCFVLLLVLLLNRGRGASVHVRAKGGSCAFGTEIQVHHIVPRLWQYAWTQPRYRYWTRHGTGTWSFPTAGAACHPQKVHPRFAATFFSHAQPSKHLLGLCCGCLWGQKLETWEAWGVGSAVHRLMRTIFVSQPLGQAANTSWVPANALMRPGCNDSSETVLHPANRAKRWERRPEFRLETCYPGAQANRTSGETETRAST